MVRMGVVLGGGGLTGTAFHAGVLTALAESGTDVREAEVIVGTSAGSTSAALIRAGFPPDQYVRRVVGEPLTAEADAVLEGMGPIPAPPSRPRWQRRPAAPDLLRRISRRPWEYSLTTLGAAALPEGTVRVDQISPGFGPLFEQWPTRSMWLTAVSLRTGRRVVFGRDRAASVADAVSASCAIPGYFAPVTIAGERFVDGGVYSSHSLDLLDGLDLDVVIVSAPLSTDSRNALEPANLPRLWIRRQLERECSVITSKGTRVIVFAPDRTLRGLMGLNSMVLAKRSPVAVAAQSFATHQIRRTMAGMLPPRS